jgi:hypothetical protein
MTHKIHFSHDYFKLSGDKTAKLLAEYGFYVVIGIILGFFVMFFLGSMSSDPYPQSGGGTYAPQLATVEDINNLLNYREKSTKYKNISIDLNALARKYNEIWFNDIPPSLGRLAEKKVDPYDTEAMKMVWRFELKEENLPEGVLNQTIARLESDLANILSKANNIREELQAAGEYDKLDPDIPRFEGIVTELDDFYWSLRHATQSLKWENCTDVYTGEPADIGELCQFRLLLWDEHARPAYLSYLDNRVFYELNYWKKQVMD